MIKPVTWLCSTTNCNRLEAVKFNSFISPTTAERAPHFNASSMAHKTSLSFCRSTKMILAGEMPKLFNAGGKRVREELIQIDALLPSMRDDNKPEIKPPVAAASSAPPQINSCIAPKGNTLSGKALFIDLNPGSTILLFDAGLKPCS